MNNYTYPIVSGLLKAGVRQWEFLFLPEDASTDEVGVLIQDAFEATTKDKEKAFIVCGDGSFEKFQSYLRSEIEKELGRAYVWPGKDYQGYHVIWDGIVRKVLPGKHTADFWAHYFGRKKMDTSCAICWDSEFSWWQKEFCDYCTAMLCSRCNKEEYVGCPVCKAKDSFCEQSRHPECVEERIPFWRNLEKQYQRRDKLERRVKEREARREARLRESG